MRRLERAGVVLALRLWRQRDPDHGRPRSVELCYVISDSGDRRTERVAVSSVPQPFGGVRWRFHCPRCGGACRVLYRPPRAWERFACRTCHRLSYTSQALAMPERWRHRASKLYRRAGCDIDDSFYYKPKRMRWSTFDRLIDEAQELWERVHRGTASCDSGVCSNGCAARRLAS